MLLSDIFPDSTRDKTVNELKEVWQDSANRAASLQTQIISLALTWSQGWGQETADHKRTGKYKGPFPHAPSPLQTRLRAGGRSLSLMGRCTSPLEEALTGGVTPLCLLNSQQSLFISPHYLHWYKPLTPWCVLKPLKHSLGLTLSFICCHLHPHTHPVCDLVSTTEQFLYLSC